MKQLMHKMAAVSLLSWRASDVQYVLAYLEGKGITHTGTLGSIEMALHRALGYSDDHD